RPTFHVSLLKPFKENSDDEFPGRTQGRPAPVLINNQWEYEVERIIATRKINRKPTQYLIKWKGYDSSENTWEPLANIRHAKKALEEFHRKNGPIKSGGNSPKNLRAMAKRPTIRTPEEDFGEFRSEEHTSELQSHRDLHSFPTRRSSDLRKNGPIKSGGNSPKNLRAMAKRPTIRTPEEDFGEF